MSIEPTPKQVTEEDRRRFLKIAKNLGIAAPVITLALARPEYAAASGFDGRGNEDDQGEDEQ